MVFSTLQNSICGLTSLYAVQGLLTRGPGECDPSWGNSSNCIPYSALESKTVARALADRRRFLEGVKHNESIDLSYDPLFSAQVYLSTEIFFGWGRCQIHYSFEVYEVKTYLRLYFCKVVFKWLAGKANRMNTTRIMLF